MIGNSNKKRPGSEEQIFKLKKPSRRLRLKYHSATPTIAFYSKGDPLLTASPPQGLPYNGDECLAQSHFSIPVSRKNESSRKENF